MDLGTGIAIVGTVFGITIPASALIIKARNGKTTGTCALHEMLIEDIREIKDDVKSLIKEVASMGR